MIAILAGLGAAVAFAASTLAATRSTRLIGAGSTVAAVVAIGLPFAAAIALAGRSGVSMSAIPLLAISGIGNVVGLGLAYTALRSGPVGVIAPLVSTEGAVAGVLAILTGTPAQPALILALVLVASGGALTATSAEPAEPAVTQPNAARAPWIGLALLAAASFGISLYATGRIGQELPSGWSALAPRVAGAIMVTLPLAARGRLQICPAALPMVLVAGLAEVAGFLCIGLGARSNLAVTAVLASQFAAVAVIGAVVLFGERLRPLQQIGVVAIAIGTAMVALLAS